MYKLFNRNTLVLSDFLKIFYITNAFEILHNKLELHYAN